ncbi:hypothetical protein [Sphingomonas rhizophila]|uniref:hypothetical protein n=1 Tax=Sphingomonas rhizophila TaxID=2071607 RepID=UPI0031B62263
MKAIVIGASGGIGGALAAALGVRGDQVTGLSRRSVPAIDLEDEASIGAAAAGCPARGRSTCWPLPAACSTVTGSSRKRRSG